MEKKKRSFEPLLMSLQSSDYNHSIPLSLVFGLNYKLENRDTTSLYYLTKNLNLKMNKKFNLSLRPIFKYKILPFIGKNPEGKE